jgi:hypothetical protein
MSGERFAERLEGRGRMFPRTSKTASAFYGNTLPSSFCKPDLAIVTLAAFRKTRRKTGNSSLLNCTCSSKPGTMSTYCFLLDS